MKITLNKSAKRALSLVLALAMLVGSLFVANVGVTFDAKAETEGIVLTWTGERATEFSDKSAGTKEDPIEITSPEELAWLVYGASNTTDGKYYKIADGIKAFNMNGMSGITLDSTLNDVNSASTFTNNWHSKTFNQTNASTEENTYDFHGFSGHFDGNGVIIYNLYDSGNAAGLFPMISCDFNGGDTVIENVILKNSKFISPEGQYAMGAGTIFGRNQSGTGDNATNSTIVSNCHVENCYVYTGKDKDNSDATKIGDYVGSGSIASYTGHERLIIQNCLVKNNNVISADERTQGGIVATNQSNAPDEVNVNNTVVVNSPCYVSNAGFNATASYANVYTTENTNSISGITTLTTTQMTGNAATENMALDFDSIWFANTAGVPVLRAFHNISATDNGNGTHSEVCADAGCGLIGLTANHLYNIVDYTTDTSSCACGDFIYGTNDVWDGTKASAFDSGSGTETDPYIIKTVEQLFLMVRSTGINDDGTPVYYKVADSVNELYINDTRGFKDQAAFEAAVGTLKNWSTGLTTEAEYCTAQCAANGTTCSATRHLDACIDFFAGKFDGNGVTIYGLYSYSSKYSYYAPGVGFVPALTDDAVIKNVIFDTNYVKTASNYGGYAGVVTSCLGSYYDGQYNGGKCENVMAYARTASDDCRASIINVAVRNAYVETKDCPLTEGTQSFAAGLVSSCFYPKAFSMSNCLFDGTNSTFKLDGNVSLTNEAAMFAARSSTQNASVTGSLNVLGKNAPQQVMTYTEHSDGTICEHNSYSLDAAEVTVENAPLLNWTAFDNDEATVEKYGTPMPNVANGWIADGYVYNTGVHLSKYKQLAMTGDNEYTGYDWGALRGDGGVFKNYDSLIGSGTEADPYIISDAITLYRIIASGGTHFGVPQYYKIDRNIDLGGMQWIDTERMRNEEYRVTFYEYHPFAGILDGDGHTISNLYSARVSGMDDSGFIPTLAATGVVKNINFRNCYAYDDSNGGGIIAGTAESGAQIIDCSLENCLTGLCDLDYGYQPYFSYADLGEIVFEGCYMVNSDGSASYADGTAPTLGENWYGIEGGIARLVSFAKAQPCADIDADGIGEEYATSDVTALKKNLLWEDGYDYIYGDVTGNGTVDMRDLAALQREMTGQETIELDGFWPNVKSGKFSIWYDEDDNYDFARKMELYLESMSGRDIQKTKGSSTANFTISILTDDSMNAVNYSSAYDTENAKLVIKGGSFTAVEEAVEYVIDNTNAFSLPATIENGTIRNERNPIEVKIHETSNDNGSLNNNATQISKGTYYYVWGDEFNTDGNISYDKWLVRDKGYEGTDFKNLKLANESDLLKLNTVANGKLTMNRGIGDLAPTSGDPSGSKDSDGYIQYFDSDDMSSSGVLTSLDSMLFKRGYMELKATLPNDSNAFPAWWLLTNPSGRSNDLFATSLYGKVFEINKDFDGSLTYSADNYKTYKYKLPTNYFEIDLFEIINNPNSGSKRNAIWYNLHKWYSNCFTGTTNDNKSFKVYDLAWDKLEAGEISDFDDQDPLLVMTHDSSTNKYTASEAKIDYHVTNSQNGQINAAINQFSDGKYGPFDGEKPSWWDQLFNGAVQKVYDVNMGTSIDSSDTVTEYIYGFLWTEEEMSYIIKDVNGNLLVSVTIDCDDLGYDNGPVLLEQYAYFLIDNHFYTDNGAAVTYNGQLIIDYVRLYQLDGHRDIVIPETEAFNSNNRFGN